MCRVSRGHRWFHASAFNQGDRANLLCGFGKVEHELARIFPRLDRFHSGEIRDRLNGSYLVNGDVLDLGTNRAMNSHLIPAILAEECFLKPVRFRGHDDGVDLICAQRGNG